MQMSKSLVYALLLPFSALSLYCLYQVGYWGLFDYHRHSPAGWQVFTDLVVALVLVMVWMVRDARSLGRSPWLWVLLTLTLGSIGPLLYLATRPAAAPSAVTGKGAVQHS